MKKACYRIFTLALGSGIIFLDRFLKRYALESISQSYASYFPYGGKAIFSGFLGGVNFSLNLVKNTGAAWGLFSQYPELLTCIRVGIVLFLIKKTFSAHYNFFRQVSLACICAGALGNLIDHFLYGYVVDLFHFTFWGYGFPVFNLADAMIFIGAAGLLFSKGRLRI